MNKKWNQERGQKEVLHLQVAFRKTGARKVIFYRLKRVAGIPIVPWEGKNRIPKTAYLHLQSPAQRMPVINLCITMVIALIQKIKAANIRDKSSACSRWWRAWIRKMLNTTERGKVRDSSATTPMGYHRSDLLRCRKVERAKQPITMENPTLGQINKMLGWKEMGCHQAASYWKINGSIDLIMTQPQNNSSSLSNKSTKRDQNST